MDKEVNIRMIVEAGIMIALSMVLSTIIIYQAPQGGSITAGSMVPIMLFGIRWGLLPGLSVGALYGLLHFMVKPYFFSVPQVILDYIVAYGALGLAGLSSGAVKRQSKNNYVKVVAASALAIIGRLVAHVVAGVVFFAKTTGLAAWKFSLVYNATYLVPELIISLLILTLIWKPIQKNTPNY